jgi:cysteine desulfurase
VSTYIYLDYAAATPLDARVLKAMQPYLSDHFANPSSLHTPGREQRKALEAARKRIARSLGAKPAEIIFTSGSTEGINLAMRGVLQAFPRARVVVSAIEHEAVRAVADGLGAQGGLAGLITVGESGVVAPAQVVAAIDDTTVLVCLHYANNEIGTIQPIAKVAVEVARIRAERLQRGVTYPLYLFCDAAQAGLLNLQVARLGVDLLSMGGSKLYGPAGSGFLYVRTGTKLAPLWRGGGQEGGLRPGTENVAAAVGLAAALELVQAGRQTETKRQAALRDWLWQELTTRLDGLTLNGALNPRLPGNLNFVVSGASGEALVAHLDAQGVGGATGSACTAANQDPSRVLLAIGRSPAEAESSLRLTIGHHTSKAELEQVVKVVAAVVPRVRKLSAR